MIDQFKLDSLYTKAIREKWPDKDYAAVLAIDSNLPGRQFLIIDLSNQRVSMTYNPDGSAVIKIAGFSKSMEIKKEAK
jgi:hypothetical protein